MKTKILLPAAAFRLPSMTLLCQDFHEHVALYSALHHRLSLFKVPVLCARYTH